jgi:hypothetical protein
VTAGEGSLPQNGTEARAHLHPHSRRSEPTTGVRIRMSLSE